MYTHGQWPSTNAKPPAPTRVVAVARYLLLFKSHKLPVLDGLNLKLAASDLVLVGKAIVEPQRKSHWKL